MIRPMRKRPLLILSLIALIALSWVAIGCEDPAGNDVTTTTGGTAASTPGPTSTVASDDVTINTERVIVGGRTVAEYEAALPALEAAAAAAPEDLAALQELAIAQYNTERYEEAAATYEKMLQLKDDAPTRNNYGNVLRDWKKWDEAKTQYEKAIALDPTYAYPYVNLAVILRSEGKADAALSLLDQGIAATTGDDKSWLETYKKELTGTTTTTT